MSKPKDKQAQIALPEATFLTESGVKFFATYRFWIVAGLWLATRTYAIWGLTPDAVLESFYVIAGDWLDGFTPYADFKVEYPPGAVVMFVLPRIFAEAPLAYGYVFAGMMLLADLTAMLLLSRIAALFFEGDIHNDTLRRYRSTEICLFYVLFTVFFGRLLFQRYDLILALLLAAIIYGALRRKTVLVDGLLAVAIWLNLAAFVWIPLVWWYGFVRRDVAAPSNKKMKSSGFSRALLARLAVLGGSLGVLFLPFMLLSGPSLGYIVQFQLDRGTQIESTAGSILMLGAKIFEGQLTARVVHGAMHLTGAASSWGAGVSGILFIIVFVILTIYVAEYCSTRGIRPLVTISAASRKSSHRSLELTGQKAAMVPQANNRTTGRPYKYFRPTPRR